jgi:D-aminoacyl-tRNA deacylase
VQSFFWVKIYVHTEAPKMILLVASRIDVAGMNIANHILEQYPFVQTGVTFCDNPVYSAVIEGKNVTYATLKDETIYAQYLPEYFSDLELIVFLSRHASVSGTPTLSVHTPGNFGSAELGGLPRTVSVCPGKAMVDALQTLSILKKKHDLKYEVSYECTHHGPSLNVPSMFVELGSSEKQWNDLAAARVVATAAMDAIGKFDHVARTAVLGIGGTHYNSQFTRMALEGEAVFGHMIPKYALHLIDPSILTQCFERTVERVECAVLDWKGIKSADKANLLAAFQEIGLPYKKA